MLTNQQQSRHSSSPSERPTLTWWFLLIAGFPLALSLPLGTTVFAILGLIYYTAFALCSPRLGYSVIAVAAVFVGGLLFYAWSASVNGDDAPAVAIFVVVWVFGNLHLWALGVWLAWAWGTRKRPSHGVAR